MSEASAELKASAKASAEPVSVEPDCNDISNHKDAMASTTSPPSYSNPHRQISWPNVAVGAIRTSYVHTRGAVIGPAMPTPELLAAAAKLTEAQAELRRKFDLKDVRVPIFGGRVGNATANGGASRSPDMVQRQDELGTNMITAALIDVNAAQSKLEVIENGATLPKTTIVEGKEQVTLITFAEDKAQRRLEVKARITLMMGIPNEHQLKFNSIKDAKKLQVAIEKRFGRNEATKKTQRNLLKQQYKNFTALSSKMLDQTFDRLQKLVSQLELLGEKLSQEDVNQKLLRSLSPERFLKNTRRKLTINDNETIGFYKSKVECYNCHKRGHFARDCRASRNQDNKNKESSKRSVPVKTTTLTALVSCDGLGGYDYKNIENAQSLNKIIECQIVDNYKKDLGYNVVPPPYTGIFMPSTPDLSFTGLDEFVNKPVIMNSKAMSSEEEPKVVRKNNDASNIEEYVLDSEEENVSQTKTEKKTVKPSIAKIEFVKPKKQEKTAKKTVKQVEQHRQNTYSPRGNQRNWNNMMSQKTGKQF
ncbi:ribonuclease H-like domain-containing protein [Tanacetum coccineum]